MKTAIDMIAEDPNVSSIFSRALLQITLRHLVPLTEDDLDRREVQRRADREEAAVFTQAALGIVSQPMEDMKVKTVYPRAEGEPITHLLQLVKLTSINPALPYTYTCGSALPRVSWLTEDDLNRREDALREDREAEAAERRADDDGSVRGSLRSARFGGE